MFKISPAEVKIVSMCRKPFHAVTEGVVCGLYKVVILCNKLVKQQNKVSRGKWRLFLCDTRLPALVIMPFYYYLQLHNYLCVQSLTIRVLPQKYEVSWEVVLYQAPPAV